MSDVKLEKLYDLLVEVMTKKLQSGEADDKIIREIRTFLKDNGVDGTDNGPDAILRQLTEGMAEEFGDKAH